MNQHNISNCLLLSRFLPVCSSCNRGQHTTSREESKNLKLHPVETRAIPTQYSVVVQSIYRNLKVKSSHPNSERPKLQKIPQRGNLLLVRIYFNRRPWQFPLVFPSAAGFVGRKVQPCSARAPIHPSIYPSQFRTCITRTLEAVTLGPRIHSDRTESASTDREQQIVLLALLAHSSLGDAYHGSSHTRHLINWRLRVTT